MTQPQTSEPRSTLRAANEPVGLLLLPLMAGSAVTGGLIWWQLTFGAGTAQVLIAVHAYVGVVGLAVVAVKLVVGIAAWRGGRRRPQRGRHVMTTLLVLVILALYGTGVLMYANAVVSGVLKTVHLWSAIAGVPVLTHHLWLFLRRARAVVRQALDRAEPATALTTRRQALVVGGLALLGWAGVRTASGVATDVRHSGPNDFPVTLTAGGSDQPAPDSWRMSIDGKVAGPLTLSLADLRGGPVEHHRYSLDCVLGWSATRTWGGVPLRHLLAEAGASDDLLSVVVRSTTGYEVALMPETVQDPRTLIAWQVDGVDLTAEHGFPARIMAPDVIGELCVKWVERMTVVAA